VALSEINCAIFYRTIMKVQLNLYTDKKENKIFLMYREIQMGSGAKSYMRKGFLIYEEMPKYIHHI
jgi:hypothetical protein